MNKENIFDDYGELVFKFLLSYTKNKHVAEDLTQETFYIALKKINDFNPQKNVKFSTWLCQIAKNLAKQEFTKNKKRNDYQSNIDTYKNNLTYNDEESNFIAQEEKMLIFQQIHNMNYRDKEILLLRLFGNLSFREIGWVFNKSENWARVSFYRAKNKMIEELD